MNKKPKSRPLRTLFFNVLLLVCVVYLSVLYFIWGINMREVRLNLEHLNSVLVQSVRTTLKGHELILRGLGQELITLDALENPENGRDLIERMNTIDPGMAGFGLVRTDGQLVLVSGIPAGSKLPNLAQWDKTRDGFAEVLAKQKMRTGRPSAIMNN